MVFNFYFYFKYIVNIVNIIEILKIVLGELENLHWTYVY